MAGKATVTFMKTFSLQCHFSSSMSALMQDGKNFIKILKQLHYLPSEAGMGKVPFSCIYLFIL